MSAVSSHSVPSCGIGDGGKVGSGCLWIGPTGLPEWFVSGGAGTLRRRRGGNRGHPDVEGGRLGVVPWVGWRIWAWKSVGRGT